MHVLTLLLALHGTAAEAPADPAAAAPPPPPPGAPAAAPAATTPSPPKHDDAVALGLGEVVGMGVGGTVGGIAAIASFAYGFNLCFSNCPPAPPGSDLAVYASPFLFVGGVIGGGAAGSAIGAAHAGVDVGLAALVGAGFAFLAFVPPAAAIGFELLFPRLTADVELAPILAGAVVGVAVAAIGTPLAFDALTSE